MEFNATFIVTIITFIVFVLLMNKILYAPILNIMEERRNFVDGNYKVAEENTAKSNELTKEREDKLSEARGEARNKYNEALGEFKEQRNEVVLSAQNSAKEDLENSRIELENLSDEAKESLKNKMIDLANDIVERVIGYRSEVQGFDSRTINEILYH